MKCYLSLGSNVGDRRYHLTQAIEELSRLGTIENKSAIYESEPQGNKNQFNFLNSVCILKFEGGVFRLLRKLKNIETRIGRQKSYRWGPRAIDIDILDIAGKTVESDLLKIPHPKMHLRKFVLIPLAEIDSDYKTPHGIRIDQLQKNCSDQGWMNRYHEQW